MESVELFCSKQPPREPKRPPVHQRITPTKPRNSGEQQRIKRDHSRKIRKAEEERCRIPMPGSPEITLTPEEWEQTLERRFDEFKDFLETITGEEYLITIDNDHRISFLPEQLALQEAKKKDSALAA